MSSVATPEDAVPGMTRGLGIREADLDADKSSLMALWREVFGHYSEERYDWLYRNNPLGAKCFVLENGAGGIVGAASVIFRTFEIDGRALLGAQAIDFAVEKRSRFGGGALQLQREILSQCKKSDVSLVYGIPLSGAEVIQRRVGFVEAGEIKRWVLPVNADYTLGKWCDSKLLRSVLRPVCEFGISRAWKRPNRLAAKLKGIGQDAIDSLDRPPGNYVSGPHKASLTGERNYQYLKWRFSEKPVFTLREEGGLKGYVIYSITNNRVQIKDLFGIDYKHADATLAEFIRTVVPERPDVVEINLLAVGGWARVLKKRGFRLRPGGTKVLACWLNLEEGHSCNTTDWFLTDADKDV